MSTDKHNLEVVSKFFADGWTCECLCGWRSDEMATQDAALRVGREHVAAIPASSVAGSSADQGEK